MHERAAKSLLKLADQTAAGRMMVFGGGGYDLDNIASAWTAVLREMTKP